MDTKEDTGKSIKNALYIQCIRDATINRYIAYHISYHFKTVSQYQYKVELHQYIDISLYCS